MSKILGVLLQSNGYRTYAIGLFVATLGVATAAGVLTPEDAAQLRSLVEQGWTQIFGLAATGAGIALVTLRAGGKADVASLAAQIAELKAAIEVENEE